MMTTNRMTSVVANNDSELVSASLSGNRDAFGQIVTRYQSLVCSLAFSATGSLSQSEDLAQETFLAAWRQLANLREPEKLRPWLCGIARNLINHSLRKQGREPSHRADSIEEIPESRAPEPLPTEQAISNEELAILWRSLERIPEIYREPLVLFYREHQSIETVAQNLDLTEDAVKQRLSRGRKLLHEQVLALIEGALERTNPSKAFTLAVIASLPALTLSAKAATTAAAVNGSATAKGAGALGWFGVLLGPLSVLIPNYIAYRVVLAGAQSDEERRQVKALFGKLGLITLGFFIPFAAIVLWLARNLPNHSFLSGMFAAGLVLIFVPALFVLNFASRRRTREYYSKVLTQECAGIIPKPTWEYRSKLILFGLPFVHIRVGDRFSILHKPVRAWIAIGAKAVGGLFACGGVAIAPVSIGGLSVGLVSFGGLSLGAVAIGGIALGIWALLGGLAIGWQAVGCFAFGWNAAAGDIAVARDFAFGCFARALQTNNESSIPWGHRLSFTNPNFAFRCAEFINNHWLWLNLFWMIPFFVQWLAGRCAKIVKNK